MFKELKNMNRYFKIWVEGNQNQESVKASLYHRTGKTYTIFMKGIFWYRISITEFRANRENMHTVTKKKLRDWWDQKNQNHNK